MKNEALRENVPTTVETADLLKHLQVITQTLLTVTSTYKYFPLALIVKTILFEV
jgi:hypothetical protein